MRSTVSPSTERDVAASDIVRVVKEYLNEMPYWRDHWEPLTVNQELAECVYDELAAKNWDLSPQYLRATVNLMAALTEVSYSSYPLLLSAEPLSACVLRTYMDGKEDYNSIRLVSIFFALAGRNLGHSSTGLSCISTMSHRRTLHRTPTSTGAIS